MTHRTRHTFHIAALGALLLAAAACEAQEDPDAVATNEVTFGEGGIVGPSCAGSECYAGPQTFNPFTEVGEGVRAVSENGAAALRVRSHAGGGAHFFSETKEGAVAETYWGTDDQRPAVRAVATSRAAVAALDAVTNGAQGAGAVLESDAGGDMLVAHVGSSQVFRIDSNGRMYSNGQQVGQKGDKGDKGDDGDKGDKGDKGEDGDNGTPGASSFDAFCGSGTNCFGKCNGTLSVSFDSPCNIGGVCSYNGNGGVCCACAQ